MKGTIVDTTIIEAPSSMKNATGTRDPKIHQVKTGNQWHFGMKAYIGVGVHSSLSVKKRGEHIAHRAPMIRYDSVSNRNKNDRMSQSDTINHNADHPTRRPCTVRRIVTGENAEGKSCIVMDGPTPNHTTHPGSPPAQVVWATGEACAEGFDPAPAEHKFGFHSKEGTILRIVDFPPDDSYDQRELGRFLDESCVRERAPTARHFWFHKTSTLDYAIVLEGEIYVLMDEGETIMRAGDVLIQRATNHSWSNRSSKPCRMAFVLVDTALARHEAS